MDHIRRLRECNDQLPTMGERDAALAEYAALVELARHQARGLRKFGLSHAASIGEIREAAQQLRDFLGIKE